MVREIEPGGILWSSSAERHTCLSQPATHDHHLALPKYLVRIFRLERGSAASMAPAACYCGRGCCMKCLVVLTLASGTAAIILRHLARNRRIFDRLYLPLESLVCRGLCLLPAASAVVQIW